MNSERFNRANNRSNPEHTAFVKKNLDLIEQIFVLMDKNGWTQKLLAQKLNKSESEISKWLSGTHNFTLQTIIKLEQTLDSDILVTPAKYRQRNISNDKAFTIDELINSFSSTFKLSGQALSYDNVIAQHWIQASSISKKTMFDGTLINHNSNEDKSSICPIAA